MILELKDNIEDNKTKEIQIVDSEMTNMTLMKQLADNDLSMQIDINTEQLLDRTKLFLVAQARNSLNRIIKLTQMLERLEDKFISAINENIDDGKATIEMISLAMDTITKLLEDANSTVMQVLKDEKLQNIVINTTNIITPDGGRATVIDADSRDEVRNLAASLLAQLSNYADTVKDASDYNVLQTSATVVNDVK